MRVYCPILVGENFLPARCMNRSMQGGHDESPHIVWSDVPQDAKSYCLLLTDLDSGSPARTLWMIINIPFSVRALLPNASLATEYLPAECVQLTNAMGNQWYDGPELLADSDPHRICFELTAVSIENLNLGPYAPAEERMKIIGAKTIERAVLNVVATRTR